MEGVGRDDEPPPGEEVLDLGVLDEPGSRTRRGRQGGGGGRPPLTRRTFFAAGGLVAAAGGLAVVASRGSRTAPSPPAPSASASLPSVTRRPTATSSPPPAVAVTNLGHPLLGATAAWDLFALGDDVVVRIRPSSGHVTRTALPPLGDGDVSLVPARGRLLIHPTDYGQGYVVPDDRPVVEMPAALNGVGPMLPGPDQDHVWVRSAVGQGRMHLMTLGGKEAGPTVPVPPFVGEAMPDGAGYVLFAGVGGLYRGSAGGLERITGGGLIALGALGWLTLDCDDRARCGTVLHRRDRTTQPVPLTLSPQVPPGILSPGGRTVALLDVGPAGNPGEALATVVDLASGTQRIVALPLWPEGSDGTLAWSPDGRWLFTIDETRQLRAVDARTLAVTALAPGLPPVRQLAVRP
jgi:hypothetical protein